MQSEWFKDWFDSPYYHILYRNRDEAEAAKFMDNLSRYWQLTPANRIWDLACGMGRHSGYLNEMGYQVTGTDLSENNIAAALSGAKKGLEFYVHDMRTPFRINYFNCVLNLFTSIGYFESRSDTLKVFRNVFQSLRADGRFVVDFFNSNRVVKNIMDTEEKEMEGIGFMISKRIEEGRVIKRIDFTDQKKKWFFEEKVSLFGLNDFEKFAGEAGFKLEKIFGGYDLDSFDKEHSERLIIVFRK